MEKKNVYEKIVEVQEMTAEKGSTNPNLSKDEIYDLREKWRLALQIAFVNYNNVLSNYATHLKNDDRVRIPLAIKFILKPFFASIPLDIGGQYIGSWLLGRLKTCFIRAMSQQYRIARYFFVDVPAIEDLSEFADSVTRVLGEEFVRRYAAWYTDYWKMIVRTLEIFTLCVVDNALSILPGMSYVRGLMIVNKYVTNVGGNDLSTFESSIGFIAPNTAASTTITTNVSATVPTTTATTTTTAAFNVAPSAINVSTTTRSVPLPSGWPVMPPAFKPATSTTLLEEQPLIFLAPPTKAFPKKGGHNHRFHEFSNRLPRVSQFRVRIK